MKQFPQTAVVILNWNGKELLKRFLPGVIKHTPGEVEIIVADNGSHDRSLECLAKHFPSVRTIALEKNHGFAGGYNRALRQVDADYYVLLNSDMEVGEHWLEPCIELLENHPEVAACQPKIRSLKKRAYFEHAGAAGGFVDHFGFPFCKGRIFSGIERDEGQYDVAGRVFWATGAAMFIRAEAFIGAGGFDERFFAHMEEIDLCWRLQNSGYHIMSCPRSVVYHLGGGSLPASNPRKTYLNFRNSLWMLAKNMPARHFYPRIAVRFVLDGIAALKFLMQGHMQDSLAVFRAHLAFIQQFRKMRKPSRELPKALPDMLYKRSIVADYFLFRRKSFSDLRLNASTPSK